MPNTIHTVSMGQKSFRLWYLPTMSTITFMSTRHVLASFLKASFRWKIILLPVSSLWQSCIRSHCPLMITFSAEVMATTLIGVNSVLVMASIKNWKSCVFSAGSFKKSYLLLGICLSTSSFPYGPFESVFSIRIPDYVQLFSDFPLLFQIPDRKTFVAKCSVVKLLCGERKWTQQSYQGPQHHRHSVGHNLRPVTAGTFPAESDMIVRELSTSNTSRVPM